MIYNTNLSILKTTPNDRVGSLIRDNVENNTGITDDATIRNIDIMMEDEFL